MARPRSDLSERIVLAACERFLLEGVDAASLRQIARDAGTSIGMIYYYFPTKDDLFLAVVEDVYAGLVQDLTVALDPALPVKDRLERMYTRIGALTDHEFTVVRMMLRESMISSDRLRKVLDRVASGHLPLVLATLADGLSSGDITDRYPPIVLMAATFSLGFIPQVARRIVGPRLPEGVGVPPPERLASLLSDLLFHGIHGDPPPSKPEP